MQVGMTGGDLEGGRDGARNAEVEKLKQLFYKDDVYEGGKGGTTAAAGATATEAAATKKKPPPPRRSPTPQSRPRH